MANLTNPNLIKLGDETAIWEFIEETKQKIKTQNWLYFEIGARLKAIRDNRMYLKVDGGYSSFEEFILQADIGFKRRTAYNYIELYEYYVQQLALDDKVIIATPYYRLLEMKRTLKDKSDEEAKEIILSQSEIPAHEYRKFKKEKGIDEGSPHVFQTPEGKWTIEFYPKKTHRVTNLETAQDIFHEPPINKGTNLLE